MFTGFKPQGLQKIASKMGYAGRMEEFDQYLQQNPDKQREMLVYQGKAQEMARGGYISKLAIGGIASANASNAKSIVFASFFVVTYLRGSVDNSSFM